MPVSSAGIQPFCEVGRVRRHMVNVTPADPSQVYLIHAGMTYITRYYVCGPRRCLSRCVEIEGFTLLSRQVRESSLDVWRTNEIMLRTSRRTVIDLIRQTTPDWHWQIEHSP